MAGLGIPEPHGDDSEICTRLQAIMPDGHCPVTTQVTTVDDQFGIHRQPDRKSGEVSG
jgi:hypothetical protein